MVSFIKSNINKKNHQCCRLYIFLISNSSHFVPLHHDTSHGATVSKIDQLFVPIKEMKYLFKFIYLRSGVKGKHGVELHSPISAESGEWSVLTLSSVCLPCCVQDTASTADIKKYYFILSNKTNILHIPIDINSCIIYYFLWLISKQRYKIKDLLRIVSLNLFYGYVIINYCVIHNFNHLYYITVVTIILIYHFLKCY